jgi:uncharacterized membrane protein
MSAEIFSLVIASRSLVVFLFICLLPGLALSCLLFPPPQLDVLERIVVAVTSSIALSSLLATALILLQDQLKPLNFALSILILTANFSVAAIWRTRKINRSTRLISPVPISAWRRSAKPVWLVATLILLTLLMLIAGNYLWNPVPREELSAPEPSTITEFYISPQAMEKVLEGVRNPQSMLEIPLEIVNHDHELAEYRLEVLNDGQLIWNQTGIQVAGGGEWQCVVELELPDSNTITHLDIILYLDSSQDSLARLRIWL